MAMLRENNNDVIVTLKESWFVLHSNMDFDLRVWNVMLIFLWKSSACLLIPNDLYWRACPCIEGHEQHVISRFLPRDSFWRVGYRENSFCRVIYIETSSTDFHLARKI